MRRSRIGTLGRVPTQLQCSVLKYQRRHVAFSPGGARFVRAGEVHRFEAFMANFSAWVMFYGPMGGELRGEVGGETP
jgi:hypothetical protein